jgi:hypothetical protein
MCVCVCVPPCRYLVSVKNGTEFHYSLVCVEEQTRRYTAALLRLLDHPSRARQMGEAGERRIRAEFDIEGIVQKFIKAVGAKKQQKLRAEGLGFLRDRGGEGCRAETSAAKKLNEKGNNESLD